MKKFGIIISLALIGFAFKGMHQYSQNKTLNILVIPFDRFEFHTEVELNKINEVNACKGDEFYDKLVNSVSQAFELNENPKIFYKIITTSDLQTLKPFLRYDVEAGKGHYTCNVEELDEKLLHEVLDGYDCDYMLTMNWYRIIKDKTSYKEKKVKKIAIYSYHFIDFDLFTREGTRIRQGSKMKFEVPANSENVKSLGLRLQDLKPEYRNLVLEINKKILNN